MINTLVIGLPGSGKTTFLGALWHLVTTDDVETALRLHRLGSGERAHLNRIAERWREAFVQSRTALVGTHIVRMELKTATNVIVDLTFPDIAGERFQEMWEARTCDPEIADLLRDGNVLLFIHADKIRKPTWLIDEIDVAERTGLPRPDGPVQPWDPNVAPTQVPIVELLQLLRTPPLDGGPRRLAIMLSAWDKAEGEGLAPQAYLEAHLPLLAQYLQANADHWAWRIYGLTAQGGDYDLSEDGAQPKPQAQALRDLDHPSERIRLIDDDTTTRDLTAPIAWLMQ
ncbi:MAG: hypothetical protein WBX26_12315 [Candidatus Cybelea sp.]